MSNLTERRTLDVPEAAQVLGISPWKAGEEIRRTGKLAGVAVIRVARRILIPKDALEHVLTGEAVHHVLESTS